LEVARGNALALGLDVEFLQADLLDGVGDEFDAVLANLPYVPQEFPLPPEVALYEPSQALFAGGDGLDLVRRLLGTLPDSVSLVALEVGFEQAAAVGSLVRLPVVEVLRDLAGLERVVVGRR